MINSTEKSTFGCKSGRGSGSSTKKLSSKLPGVLEIVEKFEHLSVSNVGVSRKWQLAGNTVGMANRFKAWGLGTKVDDGDAKANFLRTQTLIGSQATLGNNVVVKLKACEEGSQENDALAFKTQGSIEEKDNVGKQAQDSFIRDSCKIFIVNVLSGVYRRHYGRP